MATLRQLPRRNLLRLLPHLSPLSTSAYSPDPRELLRIERILHSPAPDAAQSREALEHSRSATTATVSSSLQTLLQQSAGLTTSESTSLIRCVLSTLTPHRLGLLLQELADLRIPAGEIRADLASDPEGLLSMDPGEPSCLLELLTKLRCRKAVKDQVLARGALRAAVAARSTA